MAVLAAATGGNIMLMFDQSTLLADASSVVLVAENTASQQSFATTNHVMGICGLVQLDEKGEADEPLQPPFILAQEYFDRIRYSIDVNSTSTSIKVVQKPRHGTIRLWTSHDFYTPRVNVTKDFGGANYSPKRGYHGYDSLILQVQGKGYAVNLHYFLTVSDRVPNDDDGMLDNPDCKATEWIISAAPPRRPHRQYRIALVNYLLNYISVSLHVTKINHGAVGESTDHNITFDGDGSYGWSIDSRPYLAAYFAR